MSNLGEYLRHLRKSRGLSLKAVEGRSGVSNAYLSQLERGLRRNPHPDILKRLAAAYEVPVQDLLIQAGYLQDPSAKGITRAMVERAYQHAISDPQFQFGTRVKGARVGLEVKRLIVEMYEKISGRPLLKAK